MGLLWACSLVSLICLSFWNWCYIQFIFSFYSIYSSTNILLAQSCRETHLLLEFFILPFLLSFVFPLCQILSHAPKTSLPHTFPKQRTVLSCPPLQKPVTAQSPMVCEHKVVCPAPLLPSANEWTPVHGAVKVTVTYDGFIHIKMSLSRPSVWKCLYLYYSSLKFCFFVGFFLFFWSVCLAVPRSEMWTVGDHEYAHMWTMLFHYCFSF